MPHTQFPGLGGGAGKFKYEKVSIRNAKAILGGAIRKQVFQSINVRISPQPATKIRPADLNLRTGLWTSAVPMRLSLVRQGANKPFEVVSAKDFPRPREV